MSIHGTVGRSLPSAFHPILQLVAESPMGMRLARGAFWSFAGTVVSRGMALVSWILIARLLGKTVFGQLGMIQSTVGMFGTLAGLGLGLTATRYVAEFRTKDRAKAGRIIAFSQLTATTTAILTGVLLFALSPLIAAKVLGAPQLSYLLRIGILLVLFGTLTGAQTGALSGLEAFRAIATINLLSGLASFPLMLCGAYYGGLSGLVWGMSGTLAINWLLNQRALLRETEKARIPVNYAGCWQERNVLWSFSVPVVLTGVLSAPVNWYCCALIVRQPSGFAEVGLYSATIQWQTALAFLPALLSQVLLPILSDSHSNDGAQKSRKALSTALTVFMGVILLPAVVLAALSPWITSLYGGGYQMPVTLFLTIVGYATLSNLGTALWTCLLSRNRAWFGFLGTMVWAVCLLILFQFVMPHNALGLAITNVLSYLVAMAVIFPPILKALLSKAL